MNRKTSSAVVGVAAPAHLGALLRVGPEPLSFAFSAPSRKLWVAGVGRAVVASSAGEAAAMAIEWRSEVPASLPGPWCGGWGFDASRAWAEFGAERWFLPEVLAWWDGARAWVAAFGADGVSESALRDRLAGVAEQEPVVTANVARRVGGTSRVQWNDMMEAGLGAISSGALEKFVAARTIDVEASRPFEPRTVLKALEARNPTAFTYLVRGDREAAFLGSTPELLCSAEGAEFSTEALAGTGSAEALLSSEKDLREHQAVVDDIRARLQSLGARCEEPKSPSVRQLPRFAHLVTPMRATLPEGVDAIAAARALHPTAAVAGTPRSAALSFLSRHEGFSRGWYAGAVGLLGPTRLTLCVALRSALVTGASARLFVGAGVVRGSSAEGEWQETERKAGVMLSALGVADA